MNLLTTKYVQLTYEKPIYCLVLKDEENRFSVELMQDVNKALDLVLEKREYGEPQALLTTNLNEKIFSNGLILQLLGKLGPLYFKQYQDLLARILEFPIPTVAGISGHAFAGGCMLALAHDYRVMRSDRGYICMNEVDMPAPLTPGMHSLLQAKTPNSVVLRDMLLKGHRFSGPESLSLGMVDACVPKDQLLVASKELAVKFSSKAAHSDAQAKVYQLIKQGIYKETLNLLKNIKLGGVAEFMGIPEFNTNSKL
ncbi:hypothetical protein HK099_005043 [Clydaea vesicula]|uniref:Uncharacterized protein n=1 Tax=Clydaea vesicula TaxID=447962 RepID=A0AAD5XZ74_9FUNG|nr:hypothetical protein HK099_005043 [Clydaea vesicula]